MKSMNVNESAGQIQVRPSPVLTIADGRSSDLDGVHALLRGAGLEVEGVAERIADFLVAREGDRVVAVAGLEDHGTAGLLRSVAAAPDRRNWGLARYLVNVLIERSRERGHAAVYLLTKAAEAYFERFGFRQISRAEVRPAVLASGQFRGECCESSTAMVLDLIEEPGARED